MPYPAASKSFRTATRNPYFLHVPDSLDQQGRHKVMYVDAQATALKMAAGTV